MPLRRSISIVIPNYNGAALLKKYLPYTFCAIRNADVAYEIIIVDDCSTDGSVQWLRENHPEVILLINSVNCGFSITANRGIKAAKNELVLLLNTDVALGDDYFGKLWSYFEEEDTFGVMGRIMNPDHSIEDAARKLSFQGVKFKTTRFYYCEDKSIKTPTAYLSGANALVRRHMLLKLGGVDEIFSPYYSEDVDLSFRAWRLGWKCYYEHDADCEHEVSKTIRASGSKKKRMAVVYRNKFILHAIHLEGLSLGIWYGQMILVEVLFRLLTGKFWILNSLQGFVQRRHEVRESREKLQRLMKESESSMTLADVKRTYFEPVYPRGRRIGRK